MRPLRSWLTGTCAANEVPRSPWSMPVIHVKYCENTVRFRCSCSRSAFKLAGVAVRPRIARAGSPGSACVAANTTIETRNSTRIPSRTRRTMNPAIPPRRPRRTGTAVRGPASTNAASVALGEPDGSVSMSERVEVQRPPVHLEPFDLRAVGVDQVVEERDDVPALVVLQLLHLVDDVAPLGRVHLGQRLRVHAEVVRALRRPVALVVRGRREAP